MSDDDGFHFGYFYVFEEKKNRQIAVISQYLRVQLLRLTRDFLSGTRTWTYFAAWTYFGRVCSNGQHSISVQGGS